MVAISVIVPVYKVEKYIYKCIDSILSQTLEDLEIILVDDGSPDTCGQICDEYAQKDQRVQVVHKENGGLSDARNVGFKHATGKYVIFIDSDDYIAPDTLEYLYRNIEETKADIATCGAYDVYETHIKTPGDKEEIICCSGEKLYSHILRGVKVRGEIWNKLIKREIITHISFPKGKLYEDIFFTADLIQNVKKACIGTAPKYYYVHRSSSITGQPYRRQLLDIVEGYEKVYKVVCTHYRNLAEEAQCLCIWSRFIILDKILLEDKYQEIEELPQMIRYLKKNRKKILRNRYFQPKRKIALLILCFSVKLYRIMVLALDHKQSQLKE